MPTVIIITNQNLDQFYAETMAYLDAKYHNHQYNGPKLYVSPEVEAALSQYNQAASDPGPWRGDPSVPVGRRVY